MITGAATLVLAVGLGFLIGRTGHEGSSSVSHGTETVTIENGGKGPAVSPAGTPVGHGAESGLQPGARGGRPGHATAIKKPSASDERSREEERIDEQRTKEALHAKGPLAKPTAKVGESCEEGTPGCGKDRKFNGKFFGGEE